MTTQTSTRRHGVLARSTAGIVLLGCAVLSGCSANGAVQVSAGSTPRPPAAGRTLFSDSFQDDSNGWALPPNEQASSAYEHGDFVWTSHTPNLRPHLNPETLGRRFDQGTLRMRNVVVTATFTPERGKGAMGVFCREVRDTDADFQWYEFVARDGYAAIRHADSVGHLDVLSTSTKVHLPLGRGARIQAICQDDRRSRAQLWFLLDGKVVIFARDPKSLGSGSPGLQAYDAPANATNRRLLVRWHSFLVQRPR
jgi:hypothetical protein